MTDFIREPCPDCFRKDKTIEELRATVIEQQEHIIKFVADNERLNERVADLQATSKRLRAVIMRAKDALLDGQSTQWVHDLLVAALLEPKP